jgi:hypothetical protein
MLRSGLQYEKWICLNKYCTVALINYLSKTLTYALLRLSAEAAVHFHINSTRTTYILCALSPIVLSREEESRATPTNILLSKWIAYPSNLHQRPWANGPQHWILII